MLTDGPSREEDRDPNTAAPRSRPRGPAALRRRQGRGCRVGPGGEGARTARGPGVEEVVGPRRRTFTAEFKREVLTQADACTEPGAVGALLRRHGLYSSHLTEWRRLRDDGALSGLAPKKRGRKASARNPLAEENARLQRENQKLLARAERTERLLELQKKVAELFGETLPPPPPELMPPPEERVPRARARRRRR